MEKTPLVRGFVDIEYLDHDGRVIESMTEHLGENLLLNNFRALLPLLLTPKIVSGRSDNSPGSNSWLDRRIALLGFGIGDGQDPPTVKPEEPEDGRTVLVGEAAFPNSKLGLQAPIRRIPIGVGPSEQHIAESVSGDPDTEIDGLHLLKEVDTNGVSIVAIEGGGAEVKFTFTIEDDEYIGNIMEQVLYLGGGDAANDATFDVDDPFLGILPEKVRLSREQAVAIARKTRNNPLEKTGNFKFRSTWRLRS